MYVATLAAIVGLHIRIGMEDTYWLWPHRDDRIVSNSQSFELATHLATVVGRPVATQQEYPELIGASAPQSKASPASETARI
jgi:3-keto-5-aminohexanoate cleavage enzyme